MPRQASPCLNALFICSHRLIRMNPVRSSFHSPQTPSIGRALLVWTLRDVPAALLDEVFEHDLEMRDRFLQDLYFPVFDR